MEESPRPDDARPTAGDVARLGAVLAATAVCLRLAGWHLRALVTPWSDLRAYFLPKYQWAADRIAAGELPLWNPLEFGGIPFLATIQPGVFYPPLRLAYAATTGETAYVALVVAHLLLGALGTLWLARATGLRPWPAVFAALWVLQPLWLIQIYDHPILLFAVAWLPGLALLVRGLCRRPGRRRVACTALVAALVATSGYPPYAIAIAYLLALGVPLWLVEARGAPWGLRPLRIGMAIAAAMGLAAMLAAAQLLPAAELLRETDRTAGVEAMQAMLAGLGPRFRWLLNVPGDTVGVGIHEAWARYGPVMALFILCALTVGARRVHTWWALGATVLCALAPRSWYRLLPFHEVIRFGAEWRYTAPLAVHLLAAIGLDAALARTRASARLAAATTLVALAGTLGWNWWHVLPGWRTAADFGAPPIPAWARAVCGVDGAEGRAYWANGQPRAALFRAGIASPGGYEQSLPPARAATLAATLGVGNGAVPAGWARRLAAEAHLASRASLRCVLAAPTQAFAGTPFRFAGARRGLSVHVNGHALPRARLATRRVVAASPEEALALARTAPLAAVVLEEREAPAVSPCPDGQRGTVTVHADRPETIRIDVVAACPAYLVLADTWFPGWTATVDGVPAHIYRADYAFRAVHVLAGRHTVRFRYAPRSVRAGLACSAAGLLLCGLALAWPRRRRA